MPWRCSALVAAAETRWRPLRSDSGALSAWRSCSGCCSLSWLTLQCTAATLAGRGRLRASGLQPWRADSCSGGRSSSSGPRLERWRTLALQLLPKHRGWWPWGELWADLGSGLAGRRPNSAAPHAARPSCRRNSPPERPAAPADPLSPRQARPPAPREASSPDWLRPALLPAGGLKRPRCTSARCSAAHSARAPLFSRCLRCPCRCAAVARGWLWAPLRRSTCPCCTACADRHAPSAARGEFLRHVPHAAASFGMAAPPSPHAHVLSAALPRPAPLPPPSLAMRRCRSAPYGVQRCVPAFRARCAPFSPQAPR